MELNKHNVEKQFGRYVIPSILTQLLAALYTIVDGLFIGHSVGDAGIAAVNLSWPIACFIYATATGIGTGGAVLVGINLGAGQKDDVIRARGNALLLLLLAGLFFTTAFIACLPGLLNLLGAEGEVRVGAQAYLRIIILGSIAPMFSVGLAPLLRNFGHTISVMAIMVGGGIMNVVLDGLFVSVFLWGTAGAAFATVLSQIVSMFFCLILLVRTKDFPLQLSEFRLRKTETCKIFSIGLSPFGLYLASSITLLFTNWQCIRYGGTDGLATYAVVSYLTGALEALLSGIGDGIQPLVSFAEGAREHKMAKRVFYRAMRVSLTVSVFSTIAGILIRSNLASIFNSGPVVREYLNTAMLYTPLAYPLMGLCKLFSSYLYAGGAHVFSSILIYLDPLVIAPILLFLLPPFLGLDGIWISYPATYLIMIILAIALVVRHERRRTRQPLS